MFAYVLLGILLGLILFLVIFGVSIYNSLVRQRNDIDNAFAQINVQLTRRYELIPNLVEVAKKYLQHEKETLWLESMPANAIQSLVKVDGLK